MWAQTTLYERGTEANPWSEADIAAEEWHAASGSSRLTGAINNDHLVATFGESGKAGYGQFVKTLAPAAANTKITVEAVWYEAYATGKATSYISFAVGDISFKYTGSAGNGTGTKMTVTTASGSQDYTNSEISLAQKTTYTVRLVINQASGSVSYSVSDGSKSINGTGTTAGISSFNLELGAGNLGNWATPNQLNSVKITEEEASDVASYTVKFLCGETVVKEQTVRSGTIGDPIVLTDDDKAACFNSDNTMKYIYVSDDAEGKTVTDDDGVVVTVTFREAETWTAILNADDGSEIGRNSGFEGETVGIFYPRFSLREGTLYEAAYQTSGNRYSKAVKLEADNQEETITYNATNVEDVVFYVEAEDIVDIKVVGNTNLASRGSGCKGGATQGNTMTVTTLPAGKYTLSAYVGGKKNQTFTFYAGETVIGEIVSLDYLSMGTTEEFTLTEDTEIKLKGGWQTANDTNAYAVDLIYIQEIKGDTTGIQSMKAAAANGEVFNLAGQRVAQPTKGLYITNGKKIVIR